MNERLEEALRLAAEGRSVMPVGRDKKPLLQTWRALENRRATEKEIRLWWGTMYPDAGVAVICGKISGFIGVDVDVRHGGDPAAILMVAPSERIANTAHFGKHIWYEYPDDVERVLPKVGVLPGVDIRGDGSYLVCAPSEIDPDDENDTVQPYYWETCGELGVVTEGLKKVIFPVLTGSNGKKESPQSSSPEEEQRAEGDRQISQILAGSKVHGRNNDLIRLSGYMAGKGIPRDITEQIVLNWYARIDQSDFPLTEVMRTVSSAYQAEARKEGVGKEELTLLSLAEFMDRYAGQEVDWLVDGWVQNAGVGFVVADPGSYKTWMTFDLAVSIATGTDFLNRYPVRKSGPVFIFQQEDSLSGAGGVSGRLNTILAERLGDVRRSG